MSTTSNKSATSSPTKQTADRTQVPKNVIAFQDKHLPIQRPRRPPFVIAQEHPLLLLRKHQALNKKNTHLHQSKSLVAAVPVLVPATAPFLFEHDQFCLQ